MNVFIYCVWYFNMKIKCLIFKKFSGVYEIMHYKILVESVLILGPSICTAKKDSIRFKYSFLDVVGPKTQR